MDRFSSAWFRTIPPTGRRYGSLALWLILANVIGFFTWGFGLSTFLGLGALVLLLVVLRHGPEPARPGAGGGPRWPARLLALALAGVLAVALLDIGLSFTSRRDRRNLQDIGANTHAAADSLLAGRNPYGVRTQLRHPVDATMPHVTEDAGTVAMYGIPYRYGYPYFPATFLAYTPFVAVCGGVAALRCLNLLLLAANLAAMALLVRHYVPPGERAVPVMVAFTAYLGVLVYAWEIFVLGLVDILYSTCALYAFLALARRRYGAAGLLLGLLQAAKLLPGPFVAGAILLSLWGRPGFRRVLAGYVAVPVLMLAPFVAADPPAFLSATVLFYLTNHAGGDDTSLWFALPPFLKGIFLVGGYVVAFAATVFLARPRRAAIPDAMLAAFAGYALFMAFSKMTHLNYLWSILPIGCVLLALLGGSRRTSDPAGA